jgi:hypothetical protein
VIHHGWELSDQSGGSAGGRICGKQIGEVKAARGKNFTENQENRVQQYSGNRGSYTNVGYLADAAGGFVMPVGVGVWCNL